MLLCGLQTINIEKGGLREQHLVFVGPSIDGCILFGYHLTLDSHGCTDPERTTIETEVQDC